MVRGHVEGFEAVEVVVDLRAVEDVEAHADEDVLDLLANEGEGMLAARSAGPAGQGDVDPLGRKPGVPDPPFERGLGLSDLRFAELLEGVQGLARFLAGLRCEFPQILEEGGDFSRLAPEETVSDRLNGSGIRGGRKLALELLAKLVGPLLQIIKGG